MPPERFKPRELWSVDEILEHARTGEKPEAAGYREARNRALTDAGFEPEGHHASSSWPPDSYEDLSAEQIEALTPDDHERIERKRRSA